MERLSRLVLLLLWPGVVFAQSGKLTGVVTDDTGETLIGATVQLEGTSLGSATGANGSYIVLRVPPGTYRVRFSYVGFTSRVVEGVVIQSNQTTTLDATLSEEALQGEEVVVTATRPIVDTQQTSSLQTLGREEIQALPVQNLADVVNLQAGVVDGHFRGGRTGEVQYQVDGVSVNNPYNNESTVQLDRSVLQEVQVISGTFDAEYGQALSGVVNAVLRSGDPNQYEVSGEVYLGDYVSPGSDSTTVRTRFDGVREVPLYPGVTRFSPLARQNFQLSLSGPIPLLKGTTFLASGQRFINTGFLYGQRRFMPTDSSDFERNVFNGTGDGEYVPLGFEKKWQYLGKITNRTISGVVISYQALGGFSDRQGYNNAFRFNPEGMKTQREVSIVHGLDISHALTARLFYEVGLRQNYIDYQDYKYESAFDPRYFAAEGPRASAGYEYGAIVQGVDLGRFVQTTNQFVGKAAVTWQATNVHLLKIGGDVQASRVSFGVPDLLRNVTIDGRQQLDVLQDTLGAVVNTYNPTSASFFAQDRIEWRDIVVRVGARLEYFDANSFIPGDLQNPAGSIQGVEPVPDKATTPKVAVAPRLGISFPILANASIFFSYGHFYQIPGLGQFFSNSDYSVLRDLQAGAVDYGVLGNPDLKPEFTAQYEFGFKSAIGRSLGVDLSLFYKDIRDLLGVEFVNTYTAASYTRLTNVDFGGVRGFTLSLDARDLGPLTTQVDYTYQLALGNSSSPAERANLAASGGDPRPRQVPFNWDQRHTLNVLAIWAPRAFSLTGIARFGSGQPYTPTIGTVFGSDLEPNSGRKPTGFAVDLRAEKPFRFAGAELSVFARVFNLLDARYFNGGVFADTGSPFYTITNSTAQLNPDPSRLYAPRRIEAGVSFRTTRRVQ